MRKKIKDHPEIKPEGKTERIYPVSYKGELWYEKDCDDLFACFYHGEFTLGVNCSVYVGEGLRICPDGTWIDA